MAKPAKSPPPVDYSLHPSRLVCEIVAADGYWTHAPKFPIAVEQAANLVLNHKVKQIDENQLSKRDREFIRKIANAIHLARIERGF